MQLLEEIEIKVQQATDDSLGTVLRPLWVEALERIEADHRAEVGGQELAREIAVVMDAVVLATYRRVVDRASGAHALVALGGYGRCEMAPHSDVDLLFLCEKEQDKVPEFVSGVLNPLWDLGFEVGHSSRTLAESVQLAREDLESRTAMMDGRLLAGDETLFVEFQERLYKRVPKRTIADLDTWRRQRVAAWQSVQLLEPNIKESPGGLREMQVFDWALKAKAKSAHKEK